MENNIGLAARVLRQSSFNMAFTGAGISVESGIPPFRGENGLWNRYDPEVLDLIVAKCRKDGVKTLKREALDRYPNLSEVRWVQEEPANQGGRGRIETAFLGEGPSRLVIPI